MNDSKISVRYAKALFSLALEENKLSDFKTDADLLLGLFSTNQFKLFLESSFMTPEVVKKMEHTDTHIIDLEQDLKNEKIYT